jgi:hypothetical protein
MTLNYSTSDRPLQWRQKSFRHHAMPLGQTTPLQYKVILALKKARTRLWATWDLTFLEWWPWNGCWKVTLRYLIEIHWQFSESCCTVSRVDDGVSTILWNGDTFLVKVKGRQNSEVVKLLDAADEFKTSLNFWWWRRKDPLKCRYAVTWPHTVTSQEQLLLFNHVKCHSTLH